MSLRHTQQITFHLGEKLFQTIDVTGIDSGTRNNQQTKHTTEQYLCGKLTTVEIK